MSKKQWVCGKENMKKVGDRKSDIYRYATDNTGI